MSCLPACCLLRSLWTTCESGICRPPESMQQFTNYNFNFSFCLSPFATNFRGIFHTWLRLLIWKAFLCHSIGTCHVPTHPSLTTHRSMTIWAENVPFPCVEIELRIDDRANRSPHQSTQQVRAKRVCHKNDFYGKLVQESSAAQSFAHSMHTLMRKLFSWKRPQNLKAQRMQLSATLSWVLRRQTSSDNSGKIPIGA